VNSLRGGKRVDDYLHQHIPELGMVVTDRVVLLQVSKAGTHCALNRQIDIVLNHRKSKHFEIGWILSRTSQELFHAGLVLCSSALETQGSAENHHVWLNAHDTTMFCKLVQPGEDFRNVGAGGERLLSGTTESDTRDLVLDF
jgi:hypothetical protein